MPWDFKNGEWVEVDYLPSEVPPQDNQAWVDAGSHASINWGFILKPVLLISAVVLLIKANSK